MLENECNYSANNLPKKKYGYIILQTISRREIVVSLLAHSCDSIALLVGMLSSTQRRFSIVLKDNPHHPL